MNKMVLRVLVHLGKDAIRPFFVEEPTKIFENMQQFNLTSLISFTNRVSMRCAFFFQQFWSRI